MASRLSSSMGCVGIDVRSRTVRLLQVRMAGDQWHVVGAAQIDAPLGAADSWSPTPTEVLSALTSGGFAGRRCVLSLPRSCVKVQAVRLPQMSADELAQAVEFEASHRFGMDRSELQVDYLPTSALDQGNENRDELLLVAAAEADVNHHLEPWLEGGLRPIAVDVDFAAVAGLIAATEGTKSVRAAVDVGRTGSSITVIRHGQVAMYKEIAIGGCTFDHAVSEHLDIDHDAAAELRRARQDAPHDNDEGGLDGATSRAVYEAVRPLMNDLVKEISLCLRYYGVTFRGHPPSSILLIGEHACEPRLDEHVAKGCKIPVRCDVDGDVLSAIETGIRTALNRRVGTLGAWAVAFGMSLRGIEQQSIARMSRAAA